MNLSLATDGKATEPLLDALIGYVAAGIAGIRERFGLRTLAADGDAAAARATKVRIRQPVSMASASAPVSTSRPSTSANDQYDRFQREIVPQLDAAYNFARFLSRNPDAAQDIVQEAFLRAYRRFDGYQGGDARAWIFSIVRNCYHNWLLEGRRKARVEIDAHRRDDAGDFSIDDVASNDDTPETALLRRSEAGRVRGVLNNLPRSLREVLVLRELEGLSYRQMAETLALPIGTVMSRLARGRTQFEIAWRAEAAVPENQR
ncbi:MAG: sigma-70 family polymerase sigma factor [Bradyrhizobium sp.]|nr:sigma-70 family polymerase sigma factor [Bradyrhizobium sp.]